MVTESDIEAERAAWIAERAELHAALASISGNCQGFLCRACASNLETAKAALHRATQGGDNG